MRINLLILLFTPCIAVCAPEARIEGVWLNEKKDGYIEISRIDGRYRGTITGSPNGDRDAGRKDNKNPDLALRKRPLLGLVIIDDIVQERRNRWGGGWIYDPDAGKTFRCRLELESETELTVRGYIGAPMFGRSQTWTRKPDGS